jgi:hypothetical protein
MLLTKLHVLHSIFFNQWRQVPLYRFPTFNQFQEPAIENPFTNYSNNDGNLKDLVEKEDDEGGSDEGGGGGTMKGLRVEKPTPLPTRP